MAAPRSHRIDLNRERPGSNVVMDGSSEGPDRPERVADVVARPTIGVDRAGAQGYGKDAETADFTD